MNVPVTLSRSPFSKPRLRFALQGLTIAEMLMEMRDELPPGFMRCGVVLVNDREVPREWWPHVRPRVRQDFEIIVHCLIPLQGGGGGSGGGKSTLTTVASIAVLLAAAAVSGGLAFGALGTFAIGAGTVTGAQLLGAGIGIIGSLGIAALTPPPSTDAIAAQKPGGVQTQSTTASLNGNVLQPGAPIPRVLGTHKVFPPFSSQPLIDIVVDDEVLEAGLVLSGPHLIADPRLSDIPIEDVDDTEIETREGWPDDDPVTLFTRYGKTENVGVQMSEPLISDTDTNDYKDQATPTNSFATAHPLRSPSNNFDEFWITISAPAGFSDLVTLAQKISAPVRICIRRVGDDDWVNLPELHFTHFKNEPFSKVVKIKWATAPALTAPLADKAPYAAYTKVPMRIETPDTNLSDNTSPRDGRNSVSANATVAVAFYAANFYTGAGGNAEFARTVNRIEVWPDNVNAFGNQVDITFEAVYSTNGAGVADPRTDGTVIGSVSITDGNSRLTPIVFDFAPLVVEKIWYRAFRTSGGAMTHRCGEFQVYGPTDSHPLDHFSWRAHSHFQVNANAFGFYMNTADFATTNVKNVQLGYESATIYLDPAIFPPGVYDAKVLRGNPVRLSSITQNRYLATGAAGITDTVVTDFFGYVIRISGIAHYSVLRDSAQFSSKMAINRISSVWNVPAVQTTGLAQILIKTKRSGDSLSVLASGYVRKWNGLDAFDDWGISDKPADHYYDVLTGDLNATPLPAALVNINSLIEWRALPYRINAVVEGRSAFDVLNIIAGCGYARPWQSETWGVTVDHDRTRDIPVQMFSPRNMRNFKWTKAFPRLPAGFRVRFDDRELNYKEREMIVLRPGAIDDGRYEDVRYEGFDIEAEATQRAVFDLRQAELRPITYTGECALEHIVATRGELVGVSYDVLSKLYGFSRIKSVTRSGGNVTGLVLDGSVTLDPALSTQYGAAIRGLDGSQMVREIVVPGAATDTFTLTFSAPFPDPGTAVIDEDCLVNVGALGQEQKRLVVLNVMPQAGLTGQIAFVDAADELFS